MGLVKSLLIPAALAYAGIRASAMLLPAKTSKPLTVGAAIAGGAAGLFLAKKLGA